MNSIKYQVSSDKIVTLLMDAPDGKVNIMDQAFHDSIKAMASKVAQENGLKGVIFASAKSTFFAGGDLKRLSQVTKAQAGEFFEGLEEMKASFRKIENLGVPVVAAINGTALGGGFEICLSTHYRVCVNSSSIQLGLPEVTLGLLPGAGGVTRMVRLIGIESSLPLLMEGKKLRPEAAKELGLIDELVESSDDLMAAAVKWIRANPKMAQPYDDKKYKIPGGTPSNPKVAMKLPVAPAMLMKKTKGCYPAPEKILACAVEGAQVDFDTALRIESRYLTELVTGQVAKNTINTFWFQLNEVNAGKSRPAEPAQALTKKVGIIGAGMMGAGIAYAAATRGVEVVLKDTEQNKADNGKAYTQKILGKRLKKGTISQEKIDKTLSMIKATTDVKDFEGCDLVIEAVFENRDLKASVTKETESVMMADGVFASNTSTLPITGLAEASRRPEKFIGLHFFSPVDKMPLVEIIRGEKTSDETLAKAFDFVLQIKKTPIVVNDSRGFFTSRVFGTFTNEGAAMLGEGQNASSIEQAALQSGMPVGPLAISDEVSLSLQVRIHQQTKKDLKAAGKEYVAHPADAVIDQMVAVGREGRAAGSGFYDYPKEGKKYLWSGLTKEFPQKAQIPFQDMKDRLLFIQAIETVRCLEEGVLTSIRDANIGSIFGIGFAAWSGGAIQFINQYGVKEFAVRAIELQKAYGDRFSPPKLLMDKAEKGELFV